ncbi:MAG: GDP-fucose synthetase [Desulfovibrionaceae bacterium CG1_02_65_16]|nr:MAG: GDP-fucose synthetase [Desulfovibrionaceae bacterium CG1_02_65_16]
MRKDSRIFLAGHRGLAGSALARALAGAGYANIVTRSHAELDLTDQAAVRAFFAAEKPDHVVLAAARVGGILANSTYPADFLRENLAIETNVIHEAWAAGVKRLLFLGSSCIYPRLCPQPMREEHLLTGPLEPTNRPYALAKIAGIEMCAAYNRQHGARFLAVMPTNLYGPGDSYDLSNSHVIPALIRKMHEAKVCGAARVVVWGSGAPRREFLHSDDMAEASVLLMSLPDDEYGRVLAQGDWPLVNVGCGEDMTIAEAALLVAEVVGFPGALVFDASRPDGTPVKRLDVSRLFATGWRPRVPLRQGLAGAYADFLARVASGEAPTHG